MSPETRKVHAAESDEGAMTFDGQRGVFVPASVLACLVDTLRRLSGASPVMLYDWGMAFGRELVQRSREEAPHLGPEDLFAIACERFAQYGWGALEVREFSREGLVRIVSPNPINVEWLAYTERKTPRAEDHFTRGFLAGAASEVLGTELEALELMCRANGSELCVFETVAHDGA